MDAPIDVDEVSKVGESDDDVLIHELHAERGVYGLEYPEKVT